MKNPRAKHDLLWELSRSAMVLGREAERLSTQPTIENHDRAFKWWLETLAKAQNQLDTKGETHV